MAGDCSHEIRRHLLLGRKAMTNLDRILKSKEITLLTKVHIVKAMLYPSVMDRCESRTIRKAFEAKNRCFQIVVLKKTLENPLNSREIKPVNAKGNQPWIFNGRTDAEAQSPILWPPNAKSQLTGKDSDAEIDWRQKKRAADDEKDR